jgi:SAM-dependent methyltransferase
VSYGLREAWDAEADAWLAWARRPGPTTYGRFHRDAFLAIVPGPAGLTLDLGCGEGRFSRELQSRGHRVLALDSSRRMARHAAREGRVWAVVTADAARLPLADATVDLVVAFLSLHDMDDLAAAVAEVGRVLRSAGHFCLSVVHPLNSAGRFTADRPDAPFVIEDDYFVQRPYVEEAAVEGRRMTFHSVHRPLEALFDALAEAGLATEVLREPRPHAGGRRDRLPSFLDLRACRV